MKSTPRWLIGAFAGPILGVGLILLLAPASGQGATVSGMANIAYLLAFLMHVALFALAYGVVLPLLQPRLAVAAWSSLACVAVIAALTAIHLAYQLGFFAQATPDRYAVRTLVGSVLAMMVGGLATWLIGLRGNIVASATA